MFLSKCGFWCIFYVFIIITDQGHSNPVQPVGEGTPPKLVINEIACNLGHHSYIELYSENGVTLEYKFGFTVLEVRSRKIRLHSIIELPFIDQTEEFYYVIGNVKDEWKENVANYQSMDIATPDPGKRIFGNVEEFLEMDTPSFLAFILTASKIPFSSVWPRDDTGLLLKDTPQEFQDYLKTWQIDAVVLKYYDVRGTCTKLNSLIPKMNKAIPELPATQGLNWQINLSWNRCGTATFDHLQFKTGELTPGQKNDCTLRRYTPGIEYLNYPPSNQIEHPCESELPSSNQETGVVPEEILSDEEIANEMFDQMTQQEEGTCPPSSSIIRTDMAGDYLTLEVGNAKRRRVAREPGVDEIPATIPDPETEEKRLKRATAVQQIRQYQADKIDGNMVERNWEWFNYQFNPSSPESSTYNCRICSTYLRGTIYYNLLSKKDGILQPTRERNMRTIREHSTLLTHKKAVQIEAVHKKETMNKVIAEDIQKQIDEDVKINQDIVLLTYFCAKNYNSFQFFTRLVELFEAVGVFMGVSCRTPQSAAVVSGIISQIILEDFATEFNNNNGPVQLILDGSETRNHRHAMVLLFQHLGKN